YVAGTRRPGARGGSDGRPRSTPQRCSDPGATHGAIMPVPSSAHLGGLLQVEWGTDAHPHPTLIGKGAAGDANSLIVLRRTAFVPEVPAKVELPRQAVHALLLWVQAHVQGQIVVSRAARRRDR